MIQELDKTAKLVLCDQIKESIGVHRYNVLYHTFKRVFDFVCSLIGCIFLIPISIIGFVLTVILILVDFVIICLIYDRLELLFKGIPFMIIFGLISPCIGTGIGGIFDFFKILAGMGIAMSVILFFVLTEFCGLIFYLGARFDNNE